MLLLKSKKVILSKHFLLLSIVKQVYLCSEQDHDYFFVMTIGRDLKYVTAPKRPNTARLTRINVTHGNDSGFGLIKPVAPCTRAAK
jgi:hypothetical protein